ncbi:Dystrophin, isoform D, partial [Papilio machaon]
RRQSVVSPRPQVQLTRRPHSIGSLEDEWSGRILQPVARRPRPAALATLPRPGFMPSSRSDYQLQRPAIMTNGYGAVPPSTSRRLSLPGCGPHNPPKPSATFHGLSGLVGAHAGPGGPPAPSTPAAVREAVRHLLQQPRNGFPIMDHKLSLFIDILDAQEKFSQVKKYCNLCYTALN